MNKTLKDFTASSNINAKLIRAVVRQLGDWEYFQQSAPDVANHGADAGFSGFTYYTDTGPFYAKNRALIVALVENMADELGEGSAQMVQGFNCLGKDYTMTEIGRTLYGNKSQHNTYVANALAWFALEEVANAYADFLEGGE